MIEEIQAMIFESCSELGPVYAAILSGFAVVFLGEIYLTPAGQAYLDRA